MTDHSDDSPAGARSVSRRAALGTIGALGAGAMAVALVGCSDDAVSTQATTAATEPSGPFGSIPPATTAAAPVQLLTDASLNYDALTLLGSAPYGLSEVGEVVTMVNTVNAGGGTLQAYYEATLAWGDKLATRAAEASGDGNSEGAMLDSMRAANYYESALFYVLGTTHPADEEAVYRKFRAAWEQAAPTLAPYVEQIAIPYEGRTMPGWFFSADHSRRRRPTLIINNGSDGQNSWVWGFGAAAGLHYGWNTVIFEGPGQGSMLFVDQLPFRYDWEYVISPVVDYLQSRPDVDRDCIALMGGSMAGDLAPRAAAFERRLAGLIAAPGCVSPWDAFPSILRDIVTDDKDATNKTWTEVIVPGMTVSDVFTMKKRLECYDIADMMQARAGQVPTDFWTPAQILKKQDLTGIAENIACPTLVIDYEGEAFYPGQAQQLFDMLTCPKVLAEMTSAEGAQLHCSPMAPQYHADVVFNWLNETVAPRN